MDDVTQPSTFYQIKSSDRNVGTSSDFTVYLNDQYKKIVDLTEVKLVAALIPNTLYNIRTGVNDTITWYHAGVSNYSATITPGTYTIDSLITALTSAMVAADSNNWTITYSTTSLKATITGSAAFNLTVTSTALSGGVLGFTDFFTSATSVTGANAINLLPALNLYVHIYELGLTLQSTQTKEQATFQIPIPSGPTSVIQYTAGSYYDQSITYQAPRKLDSLTVKLRLENGEAANLNGSEWNLTLQLRRESSSLQ
jgi:hypothetical protein